MWTSGTTLATPRWRITRNNIVTGPDERSIASPDGYLEFPK
jgi:hypothetical protein